MTSQQYTQTFSSMCDREIADIKRQIEIQQTIQQTSAPSSNIQAEGNDIADKFLSDSKELAQSMIDHMRIEQQKSKLEQPDKPDFLSKGLESSPESVNTVQDLLDRLQRVLELQTESKKDLEFSRLLNATIEQKLKESEKRQNFQSTLMAIVSLLAGWILSIFGSPAHLIQFFGKI